jgi:hypothetical protein
MNHPVTNTVSKTAVKKAFMLFLLVGCTAAVFATLGDGRAKSELPKRSLLKNRPTTNDGFSLRSGYAYRGNQVITENSRKFINLNTVVTYQQGNTTYIVPLKKKVILNNVKIDISNRQLKRN